MLFNRAISPQSIDLIRFTACNYEKYCKRCGEGLDQPSKTGPRVLRSLYRLGFCCDECVEAGPIKKSSGSVRIALDSVRKPNIHIFEKVAFAALELRRIEETLSHMEKLVIWAEKNFRLMSEKLGWLELNTGDIWYPNKFYRILEKLKI